MRLLRGTLLALGLGCGLSAQTAGGERAHAVLEKAGCQTSLPGDEVRYGGRASSSRTPRGERRRPAEAKDLRLGLAPMCGAEFAQVLLWAGVGVAVVLLVAALVRERAGQVARRKVAGRLQGRPVAPTVAAEPVVAAPPDPEQLAAAGDFAGAVHALLVRGIAAWLASGGEAPRHATARTLLRRAQRARNGAEPLAALVSASERVHFGGRPADRALYEASRAALQQWEAACPQPR